ncbi:MAG: hypothetical protein ACTHJW_08200 [Streptosporangiaceae bacterium]
MKAGALRPLYDTFGGHATVYLDTDRRAPNAAHAIELQWSDARSELAAAGARMETLEAIGDLLARTDLAAPGCAIFARDGTVTGTIGLRTAPALPVAVAVQDQPRVSLRYVTRCGRAASAPSRSILFFS